MPDFQQIDDMKFVFGAILIAANRMDTMLERALSKYGVTAKQWFLLIVLQRLFESPPTMKEMAKEMGSSHQNIKQVALKLQEKGLVRLMRDKGDARIIRLSLTEKGRQFLEETSDDSAAFMREFYKDIDNGDMGRMCAAIAKMMENLHDIERKYEQEESA